MLISEFDPWKSKLCTCPPKLTFNPYTGCDHGCLYCYASSYIPKFYNCRPKKDLLRRLEKEARKLKGELISISNSSDPYPNIEEKNGLTRKCLQILSRHECKIQIVTKSPLVTRDIDLLRKMRCMVALSVTTDDDGISKRLEPRAPASSERLKAIETLVEKGIPVAVRIDLIIPFLNDKPEKLIESLASLGVSHLTSSTYKVRPDNWRRFSKAYPEVAKKLYPLYFEERERISGYFYLPKELRYQLMKKAKEIAEENGMKFGCCREGFSYLNSASCDGSWLTLKECSV
jgi:DNA repair photolyase